MFVAQYLDLANKENGKISQGTDPLRYVRTVVVESGTSAVPRQAVDRGRRPRGTGTCSFSVPTPAGTVTQTIPPGTSTPSTASSSGTTTTSGRRSTSAAPRIAGPPGQRHEAHGGAPGEPGSGRGRRTVDGPRLRRGGAASAPPTPSTRSTSSSRRTSARASRGRSRSTPFPTSTVRPRSSHVLRPGDDRDVVPDDAFPPWRLTAPGASTSPGPARHGPMNSDARIVMKTSPTA